MDPWDLMASQLTLLGSLQCNERASCRKQDEELRNDSVCPLDFILCMNTHLNLPTHKQEAKLNTSAGLNISHILFGIFIVVA